MWNAHVILHSFNLSVMWQEMPHIYVQQVTKFGQWSGNSAVVLFRKIKTLSSVFARGFKLEGHISECLWYSSLLKLIKNAMWYFYWFIMIFIYHPQIPLPVDRCTVPTKVNSQICETCHTNLLSSVSSSSP